MDHDPWAYIRASRAPKRPRIPQKGVSRGYYMGENGPKWVKNRFFQISPGGQPGVGKCDFRPLDVPKRPLDAPKRPLDAPIHIPYTLEKG